MTTIRPLNTLDVPAMNRLLVNLEEQHPQMLRNARKHLQGRIIQMPDYWKAWGEFEGSDLLTWVQFRQWDSPMNRCYHWHATNTLGVKPGALFDIMTTARDYFEFIHCFTMYALRPLPVEGVPFCQIPGSPYADYDLEVIETVKAGDRCSDPELAKYLTPYTFDKDYDVLKMTKRGVNAVPNLSA